MTLRSPPALARASMASSTFMTTRLFFPLRLSVLRLTSTTVSRLSCCSAGLLLSSLPPAPAAVSASGRNRDAKVRRTRSSAVRWPASFRSRSDLRPRRARAPSPPRGARRSAAARRGRGESLGRLAAAGPESRGFSDMKRLVTIVSTTAHPSPSPELLDKCSRDTINRGRHSTVQW